MARFILVLAASLLLVACGDDAPTEEGTGGGASTSSGNESAETPASGLKTPAGWPSAESRRLAPDREPSPYSPEQIAKACGPRSKRVIRFEEPGKDVRYEVWTFTDHTADGATWHRADCDENGTENGEKKSGPVTWKQLQSHASWPAKDTTATEARMKTPAGDFACMHFVVKRIGRAGSGEDKYWFAWDLPGPPLRLERYVNGNLMVTVTQIKIEGVKQ